MKYLGIYYRYKLRKGMVLHHFLSDRGIECILFLPRTGERNGAKLAISRELIFLDFKLPHYETEYHVFDADFLVDSDYEIARNKVIFNDEEAVKKVVFELSETIYQIEKSAISAFYPLDNNNNAINTATDNKHPMTVVTMTDYLKKWREEMPAWLANYRPGDHVAFSDFISGRVGYYPGCYFDGCLIETANIAQCVHAFLYVDYGVTREQAVYEFDKPDALRGYHSIGRVEWPFHELLPHGLYPLPSDLVRDKDPMEFVLKDVAPFCIMEIFERNADKDDSWGSDRLAVTYLFGDGITTYYRLFVREYKKAPWLFLLQDHGFGGNYDRFGKYGILDAIIQRYRVFPDFVIRDIHGTEMWDGYDIIHGVGPVIGGMHRNIRKLYRRNASEMTNLDLDWYLAHGYIPADEAFRRIEKNHGRNEQKQK
ncbi:MAG: hypothetical protein IKR25_13135 [Muribaculaceae bacterium]|nr:hypothetical protein [Muribaculaceae bacterium]